MRTATAGEEFSYESGILEGQVPSGMMRDTLEVEVGQGDRAWTRAREALSTWQQFDLAWVDVDTGGSAPEPDVDVLVLARLFGLHLTAACRVVSTHDVEDANGARFGFTYGSLQSHFERGEELFEVARAPDGVVTYRIDVMARPARWYTRLARPIVDRVRLRFRRESAEAMRRYVAG